MANTDFLKTIGTLVNHATEVKVGDIVGHAPNGYPADQIRLYCIKHIEFVPNPPYLMPTVPRLYFLAPHVGIGLRGNEVNRWYIHTPMPGESYKYTWADYSGMSGDDMAEWTQDDDYAELIKNETFDMYLIVDEQYKKLGNLIPKVVVPSWGILGQTMRGPEHIFSFVDDIQEDLRTAKEAYERIQNRVMTVPWLPR